VSPAAGPPRQAIDYTRVSGPDDESNETQRRVCAETARRDGYVIPADGRYHYADCAISGAERHRQGLDELIGDVQAKRVGPEGTLVRVDQLYIRDPARLWRGLDPRFPQYFEYLMQEYGILVRYTNEEEVADYSEGVRGRHVGTYISRTVNQVNAAGERLELREKSRRRKRQLVLERYYPNAVVPYGIERVLIDKRTREFVRLIPRGESIRLPGCRFHLRPMEGEEARIVRFVYDSIIGGLSLQAIADELKRRGIPSPKGLEEWSSGMVGRIARNPIYKGTLLWGNPYHWRGKRGRNRRRKALPFLPHTESEITGEAPILYDGFLDALVPKETWDEVQDILSGRRTQWEKRRTTSPAYLLTGKVRCAGCGGIFSGRTHLETKHLYVYYAHDVGYKRKYRSCPNCMTSVRAECLEGPVLERLRELLASGTLDALVRDELDRMRGSDRVAESERRAQEVRREIVLLEQRLDAATEDSLNATGSHRDSLVIRASRIGVQLDAKRADLCTLEEETRRVAAMRDRHLALAADGAVLVAHLDSGDPVLVRKVVEHAVEVIRFDRQTRRAEVVLRLNPTHTYQ
jgi:hypothetical protein